jgi:hypothetical protein
LLDEGIRKDGDWWYVPVTASGPKDAPLRSEYLVNVSANIEQQLEEEQNINVLFIPVAA